jgi:hypothetical protein
MVAKDIKGRTVLDDQQITLVTMVLFTLRKSKTEESQTKDVADVRDVLHAMTIAGFAALPQGGLDGLYKSVLGFFTEITEVPRAEGSHIDTRLDDHGASAT